MSDLGNGILYTIKATEDVFVDRNEEYDCPTMSGFLIRLAITWNTMPSTGVAPPSFIFIRAGTTLYQLTTSSGHISFQSILILAAMAILSLTPVLFKRTLRRKLE